jgi:hypothetical protein
MRGPYEPGGDGGGALIVDAQATVIDEPCPCALDDPVPWQDLVRVAAPAFAHQATLVSGWVAASASDGGSVASLWSWRLFLRPFLPSVEVASTCRVIASRLGLAVPEEDSVGSSLSNSAPAWPWDWGDAAGPRRAGRRMTWRLCTRSTVASGLWE